LPGVVLTASPNRSELRVGLHRVPTWPRADGTSLHSCIAPTLISFHADTRTFTHTLTLQTRPHTIRRTLNFLSTACFGLLMILLGFFGFSPRSYVRFDLFGVLLTTPHFLPSAGRHVCFSHEAAHLAAKDGEEESAAATATATATATTILPVSRSGSQTDIQVQYPHCLSACVPFAISPKVRIVLRWQMSGYRVSPEAQQRHHHHHHLRPTTPHTCQPSAAGAGAVTGASQHQ
jgi:hypothetical protein